MKQRTLARMVAVAKLREEEAQRALASAVERELDAVRQAAAREERIGRMRAMRGPGDPDDLTRHANWAMREELGRRAHEVTTASLRAMVEDRRAAVVSAVLARRMASEVATRAAEAEAIERSRAEARERDDRAARRPGANR